MHGFRPLLQQVHDLLFTLPPVPDQLLELGLRIRYHGSLAGVQNGRIVSHELLHRLEEERDLAFPRVHHGSAAAHHVVAGEQGSGFAHEHGQTAVRVSRGMDELDRDVAQAKRLAILHHFAHFGPSHPLLDGFFLRGSGDDGRAGHFLDGGRIAPVRWMPMGDDDAFQLRAAYLVPVVDPRLGLAFSIPAGVHPYGPAGADNQIGVGDARGGCLFGQDVVDARCDFHERRLASPRAVSDTFGDGP